jgi:hypothetical protein
MLKKENRKRFVIVDDPKLMDYYLTNFRMHPDDYPSTDIAYQIQEENSTIMRVYKFPKAKSRP